MRDLGPVTMSPLPAGIILSFVCRGHSRKEGLFSLVPRASFPLVPVVNSNQNVKDTQSQSCSHLSQGHWHPRRQFPRKCQQHSHEQLPRASLSHPSRQNHRGFCGHPRGRFPVDGTWAKLSSIQWRTVTLSPVSSESHPRRAGPLPNLFLPCMQKANLFLSSTHYTSDTKWGVPTPTNPPILRHQRVTYNSIINYLEWAQTHS